MSGTSFLTTIYNFLSVVFLLPFDLFKPFIHFFLQLLDLLLNCGFSLQLQVQVELHCLHFATHFNDLHAICMQSLVLLLILLLFRLDFALVICSIKGGFSQLLLQQIVQVPSFLLDKTLKVRGNLSFGLIVYDFSLESISHD